MRYTIALLLLSGCFGAKPSDELGQITHDVLTNKSKEGIDIKITPVEEEKVPKASRPKVELLKH